MPNEDFSPSEALREALARSTQDGIPPYELVLPRRPIVEDLRLVPEDASFIATRGTARALERLPELAHLVALWANPASPHLFTWCARAPRLRAIYVTNFRRLSSASLAGAPRLEHLMLAWAPRLSDLGFLQELPALRTLYLEDMKRIDLSTLPHLPQLTGLHLGGTLWNALVLPSLASLERVPNLRYLRLGNVRVLDRSLQPLARLLHLRQLHLPNVFDIEETARLSAALPSVKSNSSSPFFGLEGRTAVASAGAMCDRCGAERREMTGRPAVLLCPACDDTAMRRRVARWEAARASSWPAAARGKQVDDQLA